MFGLVEADVKVRGLQGLACTAGEPTAGTRPQPACCLLSGQQCGVQRSPREGVVARDPVKLWGPRVPTPPLLEPAGGPALCLSVSIILWPALGGAGAPWGESPTE